MDRGGGRGETPDSGGGVYVEGGDRESYSLSPNRNSNNAPPIRTQIPDQMECGALDPQLHHVGVTGRRYRAGAQEGSVTSADMWYDGDSNIRDAAEM